MNKSILHTDIQEFIRKNLNSDIADLLLKGISFNNVDTKTIVQQIEAKKRAEKKLPTWFSTDNIYYPQKLNIEQTSSEIAAKYKAQIISGKRLIDLTGGFGVDAYYFSKKIKNIIHCEIDTELSKIVEHNYKQLNVSNVKCKNDNGIEVLKRIDKPFDWIYIDPSRRDDSKDKVFLLSDCAPNIKTFQGLFLKYAQNVMIKTSPLLDISATLKDLKHVKCIHIVAIANEVKELLWVLERNYARKPSVSTVNIRGATETTLSFEYENEPEAKVEFSAPLNYLYEPNAAILKAGAFNSVSEIFKVFKLHKHSHLYTSEVLIDFPGRCFKVIKQIPFNKKALSKLGIKKANVTTRNFPLSVSDIRKKLKIKDGGHQYLFFTTDITNTKVILMCSKV